MTADWYVWQDWLLRTVGMLAALVTVALSEPRLNQMAPCTRPGFRLAFMLLTAGGCWQILEIMLGKVPTWATAMVWAGIAALLVEERHCPRSCTRKNGDPRPIRLVRRPRDNGPPGHPL